MFRLFRVQTLRSLWKAEACILINILKKYQRLSLNRTYLMQFYMKYTVSNAPYYILAKLCIMKG